MIIVFKIFILFVFTFEIFAQDKGTIPPGPIFPHVATESEIKKLEADIKFFLEKVSEQKKICKKNKLAQKESDFTNFYMGLVLVDSPYLNNAKCGEKNETEIHQHHPYVKCIFQDSNVRNSLKEVLSDQAYVPVMSDHGKSADVFSEMTQYYQLLIKDYEN